MTVVRGFEVLTGSYLGQEWDLYGETADDAMRVFLHEGDADDIIASIAGLEALVASSMTEQEFRDHWIFTLHGGYDPRDDGYTFRDWFAHALALLRTEAEKSPG